MHISRPLAVLSAAAIVATCLGSTAAAAAPADRSPRPAPRGTALQAPRAESSAIAREQMRRALVAQSHRGTTTFSVKSSRAATKDVRAAAAALGASTGGSGLAKLGWTTVTVPSSEAAATRARLEATPGVTAVSEAQLRLPDYTPNDPRYASQQTLMTAMQAPTAWDSAKGSGVTIAILDGGFDASHPDLSSKVTSTWDVVKGNSTVTDSPTDTVPGHGTAAASAAAAATNNSAGIAGAAPLANLMLIQVGNDTDGGAIFSDKSALGITYAVDHGADIISMSYGAAGSSDLAEADAVAYALANDVLVVASAGNDGTNVPHYPAAP
jgi:subtilisin family serine protease